MKTILCYGDSNTWGFDPAAGGRFDLHTRWAGVLRDQLGDGYWVIEEGLGGRTTVHDDPLSLGRNGRTYFAPCLLSHQPLDLVIILLGTNDLKLRFSLPASDIAAGVGELAQTVLSDHELGTGGTAPRVLIICPPPLAPLEGTRLSGMFEGGDAKSRRLAAHYRLVAEELACDFLNAGAVIVSSPLDAIHWEADQHRLLGIAVADKVRDMLKES